MTNQQKKELAILQQTYLSKVQQDDKSEQLRIMELIFFWIRKQIFVAQIKAIAMEDPLAAAKWKNALLTQEQRADFGFLQIQMIGAWSERNIEVGVQVEIEMRDWIDRQINAGVVHALSPYFQARIVRLNTKKN
jgi:hypothetical protein